MVVLLRPSGSGKSTLINILGGLDQASGGHAWFYDRDLTAWDNDAVTEHRRASVGFVFQFYNLIASSLLPLAIVGTAVSFWRLDRSAGLLLVPYALWSPVPEPSTWALMIGGFGLAGAMLRRLRGVAA